MASSNEVVFERTLNAPPDVVWRAWTEPEMLKSWWGPENVFIPECEVDVREGGRLYLVMEADEGMGQYKGTRWPMEGAYTLVEENSALSFDAKGWTEGQEEDTNIDQTSNLTLKDEGGKTKMRLEVTVHKTGPKAGMAIEGMRGGFNQQFDKLEKFLAQQE